MIIQENNYSDRDLKQNWNEKNNERKKAICLRRYYHSTVKKNAWWESSRFGRGRSLGKLSGCFILVQNTGFILYVTVSSITQVLSTLILPSSRSRETRRSSHEFIQKCSNADNVKGLTSL